jgi:ABC-type branched-subunit amino acid transport system substrate-binding protein
MPISLTGVFAQSGQAMLAAVQLEESIINARGYVHACKQP